MTPSVLLVNPWIYDFAAYDLWARPLGLLYIGAMFRAAGVRVRLVDCMDRAHPQSGSPPARPSQPPGTGPWRRKIVPTPGPLESVPRHYSRYGWPRAVFAGEIAAGPKPDLVLVTSGMTYWYPGVAEAITVIREVHPGVPVILGGIYATFCPEHAARNSGADRVLTGPAEWSLPEAAAELAGLDLGRVSGRDWKKYWPDIDLYAQPAAAPLLTSRGCPYRCPYCASHRLYPKLDQRTPDDVLAEIEDRHLRLGLTDFTFFDDALLIDADRRFLPIMEGVVRRGYPIRFHAPNGLHVGLIDRETAHLMKKAGFHTIRLGVETLDPNRREQIGNKTEPDAFRRAAANLKAAGFEPDHIGGYILFGLPGQDLNEVLTTAKAVRDLGVKPHLAEYSPLPGTPLWEEAVSASPYDLDGEPLYHNNTFFPCRQPGFSWERVWSVKREAFG